MGQLAAMLGRMWDESCETEGNRKPLANGSELSWVTELEFIRVEALGTEGGGGGGAFVLLVQPRASLSSQIISQSAAYSVVWLCSTAHWTCYFLLDFLCSTSLTVLLPCWNSSHRSRQLSAQQCAWSVTEDQTFLGWLPLSLSLGAIQAVSSLSPLFLPLPFFAPLRRMQPGLCRHDRTCGLQSLVLNTGSTLRGYQDGNH